MANRKEYEMLFKLNAQLGGSYNSISYSLRLAIYASFLRDNSLFAATQCISSMSGRPAQNDTGVLLFRAIMRHCCLSHSPPSPAVNPT